MKQARQQPGRQLAGSRKAAAVAAKAAVKVAKAAVNPF